MMRALRHLIRMLPVFLLLYPQAALAAPDGGITDLPPSVKDLRCRKDFKTGIEADTYSYRVPLLIRIHDPNNPSSILDERWVYGDACRQKADQTLGEAWSSLVIGGNQSHAVALPTTLPVPAVERRQNGQPIYEQLTVPSSIPIGVEGSIDRNAGDITATGYVAQLAQAGFLIAKGLDDNGQPLERVWVGYSTDFSGKGIDFAKTLGDIRFLKVWEPAFTMLCQDGSRAAHAPHSPDVIRTRDLMAHDSLFPLPLSADFDCIADENWNKQNGRATIPWGGGVGIIELYPNLALEKTSTPPTYVGDKVSVDLLLQNQSAASKGTVQLFCAYQGTGIWERCETGSAKLDLAYEKNIPVTVTFSQPKQPSKLHILAIPDDDTGFTVKRNDNVIPRAPAEGEDENNHTMFDDEFIRHYAENMRDNYVTVELEPLCDLQIALSTDGFASPEGFQIQTIVTRTQCTALESATVTLTVNGERVQVKPGFFAGETATIPFESGPIDMGDAEEVTVALVATVDAGNYVPESNEENNTVTKAVVIGRPADPTFTCPSGLSPDQCFTTQITN